MLWPSGSEQHYPSEHTMAGTACDADYVYDIGGVGLDEKIRSRRLSSVMFRSNLAYEFQSRSRCRWLWRSYIYSSGWLTTSILISLLSYTCSGYRCWVVLFILAILKNDYEGRSVAALFETTCIETNQCLIKVEVLILIWNVTESVTLAFVADQLDDWAL